MYKFIYALSLKLLNQQVPATGIGLFRMLYGIITLQEILFLYYFRHLIFDPIPFIDVEFPMLGLFLTFWALIACCVITGYRYQFAVTSNYIFWLIFVNFTSMQRDFDGGFDLFMIGAGCFLLFMPGDKALSFDNLRKKLSVPFNRKILPAPTVSILSYYLPIFFCLGLLYLDSSVHKMFAEHWRNGLGAWLPSTQPYYVSALDMSFFLNNESLQKTIGYTILVFQFTFLFLFWHKTLRFVYLFIGAGLHLGITLSLNIYPFGLGMLIFYSLLIPHEWWQALRQRCTAKQPSLTVFYDQQCPLCNRTVTILNHFDLFKRIDFRSAQEFSASHSALKHLNLTTLLTDLYAVDQQQQVYAGVDTYIQIGFHMIYTYPASVFLKLPGIYSLAKNKYRAIADNRQRTLCTETCLVISPYQENTLYYYLFENFATHKPKNFARKLSKIIIALLVLQLNSTVHYGIIYRLDLKQQPNAITIPLTQASNALLSISQTFLGIAPHALYLHDHFKGYDRILAITYTDTNGKENWLPFVNEQGRLLAPNWGRVQSMWANIAVTPTIDNARLHKFIMKVTAFWGQHLGLNLNTTVFHIHLKKINAPNYWVYDQLHKNFSSPWLSIGDVQWQDNKIIYHLPNDINSL
ncbi:MAG: DCC1-like thiol-disulfide oxidoreductase family protein [Methylovulum sp.]|jgi:predicted DCC family thiol-disulfide oxidoreductase YuxK|nr:DCC1-like thiol-disulfide oxidoreductase family protein [Methylovulum sp.]